MRNVHCDPEVDALSLALRDAKVLDASKRPGQKVLALA